jgi:hypothetical protein
MGTLNTIEQARDLLESFDHTGAMTIGFDENEYTLTGDQMQLIASALYLAECKIYELTESNK